MSKRFKKQQIPVFSTVSVHELEEVQELKLQLKEGLPKLDLLNPDELFKQVDPEEEKRFFDQYKEMDLDKLVAM